MKPCWLHLGGEFPLQFDVSYEKPEEAGGRERFGPSSLGQIHQVFSMALLVEVKGLMQKLGFFLEVKHRTPSIYAFIFIKTPFVYTRE